jgi:integrase
MSERSFLSDLDNRFSDFLAFRRLGGIDTQNDLELLRYFDRFLAQQGFRGPWPTREVITAYLASIGHLNPRTQENRLSLIRQFCRYLCPFEPQCFVPEDLLPRRPPRRRDAYVFSETEIQAIVQAARALPPPGSLRPKTYATLFGLLYTTGLRCGEAFALNLSDVNLADRVLFIHKGKFGKSRWVPISASTAGALAQYLEARSRAAPPQPQSPFFITRNAGRLYHTTVEWAFRQVLERCGLRGGKGCPGPRLHHLRHSFACHRLLAWYREGKDVNALLPVLATYLGHVRIASTQVYLHASAELLEQASARFHQNFLQHIAPQGIPS